MNLTYVFHQGDPVLIATFLALTVMSLAGWYLMLWKGWKLYCERHALEQFRLQYPDPARWPAGMRGVVRAQGAVAVLIKAGETAGGKALLEMHLSQALDCIRAGFERGLTVLASVGSSAPFVGLFGTVWGIYGALTRIAAEGNASLNVVAGPMGEALVATAAGLFAAIPAILAYNAFVRANRLLLQDLRHIAEQIAAYATQEESAHKISTETVRLAAGG